MANWQVISLDTVTPQLRAPGTGDGYSFNSGSTQLGVWTTTGLGIGTASPAVPLDVVSNAGSNGINIRARSSNDYGFLNFKSNDGSDTAGSIAALRSGVNAGSLLFYTGTTEQMRLTSTGLGIGTSSPAYKLHVATNAGYVAAFQTTAGADYRAVGWLNSAGSIVGDIGLDITNTLFKVRAVGMPLVFGSGADGTDRMRLDSSGNLGIGTTSPAAKLDVVGGTGIRVNEDGASTKVIQVRSNFAGVGPAINVSSNDPLLFQTNNTERARITSGGDLLVGTTSQPTSADNRVAVVGTRGIDVKSEGGTTATTATFWNNATTGDNSFVSFRTETADTSRGSITYNRGAGQVAYNTTSDARLKENIADAEEAGNKIDAMQVRQFDWKETGNHLDYGFVAQELHAVAPHAVSKPEDEEAMWSVDYSKLVPMLVKEIQSLRARVAQLEAK